MKLIESIGIVEGVPTKHVRGKFQGKRVWVPVQAVRRICEECGAEFWAWPDSFDWTCACCQFNEKGGVEHE